MHVYIFTLKNDCSVEIIPPRILRCLALFLFFFPPFHAINFRVLGVISRLVFLKGWNFFWLRVFEKNERFSSPFIFKFFIHAEGKTGNIRGVIQSPDFKKLTWNLDLKNLRASCSVLYSDLHLLQLCPLISTSAPKGSRSCWPSIRIFLIVPVRGARATCRQLQPRHFTLPFTPRFFYLLNSDLLVQHPNGSLWIFYRKRFK